MVCDFVRRGSVECYNANRVCIARDVTLRLTATSELRSKSRQDLVTIIEKERIESMSSINALSVQNQALLKDKAQLELRLAQYQTQLRDYVELRAKATELDARVKESLDLLQEE